MKTTIAELLFNDLLPELQANHFEQTWYTSFNLNMSDQKAVIEDFTKSRFEIQRFEDTYGSQVGLMLNFKETEQLLSGPDGVDLLTEEEEEWKTQLFVSQSDFSFPTLRLSDSSDGIFKRYLLRDSYETEDIHRYFTALILSDSSYDLFFKSTLSESI